MLLRSEVSQFGGPGCLREEHCDRCSTAMSSAKAKVQAAGGKILESPAWEATELTDAAWNKPKILKNDEHS